MTSHASSSAAAAFALPVSSATSSIRRRNPTLVRAQVEPSDKSVEIMRKFSEQYARRSGTYFCVDKGVTSVVIKGLADHKDSLGAPLCPCRHYDDKAAEAAQGFWNCPCVPMRERKECHCMLFLTPDNDFAGKEQSFPISSLPDYEMENRVSAGNGIPAGNGNGGHYNYALTEGFLGAEAELPPPLLPHSCSVLEAKAAKNLLFHHPLAEAGAVTDTDTGLDAALPQA
ncbi:hypothetical protein Ahy_B05g075991 isoform A [Arachis hypogaea]|uniref:Ferredoxin-thioredoxin reductase catalytic chain, chloroplastic n=1 Tax=Arachis hypogaea TaxID=3818 RepID=A0A444Z2C9_ARAHY|nr:hypothetical protein Ahy_B05g075991 isoform A [Arachis hypogaea]